MNKYLDQQSKHGTKIQTLPWSKVLHKLLLLCFQIEGDRNILNLRCRPFAFISYRAFLENKKRSGPSFHVSFSAWILMKNVSGDIFINQRRFIVWLPSWDVAQYLYCNFLLTRLWRCDILKLTLSLPFLSSRFPTWSKDSGQKL